MLTYYVVWFLKVVNIMKMIMEINKLFSYTFKYFIYGNKSKWQKLLLEVSCRLCIFNIFVSLLRSTELFKEAYTKCWINRLDHYLQHRHAHAYTHAHMRTKFVETLICMISEELRELKWVYQTIKSYFTQNFNFIRPFAFSER